RVLDAIIMPVVLDQTERLKLLNISIDKLQKSFLDGTFSSYAQFLTSISVDGTFLRMSDGYFRTGYSDDLLFSDLYYSDTRYWALDIAFNSKSKGDIFEVLDDYHEQILGSKLDRRALLEQLDNKSRIALDEREFEKLMRNIETSSEIHELMEQFNLKAK